MKVAYFVAEFHRFTGSQKSLLLLLRYLPRDIQAKVIFPGHGKCVDVYREHGIDVEVLDAPAMLNLFGKKLLRTTRLQKMKILLAYVFPYSRKVSVFLKKERVNLVHYNTSRGLLMSCGAPYMAGIPSVLHVRGILDVLGTPLACVSLLQPHRLFLVAENLKKHLSCPLFQKSIQAKSVVVLDLYERVPPEESVDTGTIPVNVEGKVVVLTPSSLVPFKGYHHLLRAIQRLPLDVRSTSVFIGIGEEADREYRAYIEGLTHELGIDNFHFLGWQREVSRFYAASDIVVLPSVEREFLDIGTRSVMVIGNEGLPRVVLEALSFGKPVIGTSVAGVPELVNDGINGFLVPPGDSESLARALTELILDSGKRRVMGDHGKSMVPRFSPETLMPIIRNSYDELCTEYYARRKHSFLRKP